MKYSAKQITKAGVILTTSKDADAVAEAIKIINDWRVPHFTVIEILMKELKNLFLKNTISFNFSSYRLKRMSSIQYKLDINPKMGLGGMQDIAGGRFVFPDISILSSAYLLLQSSNIPQFELVKEDDYVRSPKDSGYRSIHLVYKYHSSADEDMDNMKVEIQLRTQLQHSWAMAVETAGLVTNTAMKSGQGSDEWQYFFHVVSCLFSIKENTPVMQTYCKETSMSLINKLRITNKKYKFLDQLQALKVSFNVVERNSYQGAMYLLYINFETKMLQISTFNKDSSDEANEKYYKLENYVRDGKSATVLVSVSDYKKLRDAYPSYFLDMDDFNNRLNRYLNAGKKFRGFSRRI